uniref:hypothetical protein n=1 Tax=Paracoccus sp. TRP TaxID=412597 RepID=UPI000225F5B8|nr:hypothetical protein [Paracoccus sp. TRP]
MLRGKNVQIATIAFKLGQQKTTLEAFGIADFPPQEQARRGLQQRRPGDSA